MKRIILPFLFLAVALVAQGQTKLVFEETLPESYLIKYTPASTTNQTNINSILTLLGKADEKKGNGRPDRTPEFIVRFEQHARIANAGDKLQLLVQLSKFSTTTGFNYRGFDVADVLQPEMVSAKIRLLNAQGKEVKLFNPQQVALNAEKVILLDASIPDSTSGKKYTLKVDAKEMIFTAEDVREVQDRIDLIQDYYKANRELAVALKDVLLLIPDDVDRLSQYDRQLHDMEVWFEGLKVGRFKDKLKLARHDPENMLEKARRLKDALLDRRQAINHAIATLDQQYYNRGVDLMMAGNTAGARSYFAKSIEVNPGFAPAHLQLAQIDFRSGYLPEAVARIYDILAGMRADPETKRRALLLAHDIYSTHITQGNNLTGRGEYGNALKAFADARTMCNTIGGLQCNLPALNDGEARAASGMYRAIIREGKDYLSRNDLAKAEDRAEEALQFQQEYNDVLQNASEATELLNQVKYHYYVRHIDTGKSYLNEKNYTAALEQFDAALHLEQAYSFNRVKELKTLAKIAAKPVMLQELRDGYMEARNNRLSDARSTASEVAAMQKRFALEQDKDIQNSFALLQERIATQECVNAQATYDSHYQKAQELEQNKQFLAADKAYLAALDVAKVNGSCQIASFTAKDGRAAIEPAVAYQRMLEDINRFVADKKYKEAIERYRAAEKHYVANQVNKFGLDHVSLYNFAMHNSKEAFTATVVQYLADLGEEKIALDLLTSLVEKGYARRKTKDVQEQLGKQLAQEDIKAGLKNDPKKQAGTYVQGNRKLNRLGSAYVKEYKKLAKR